MVTLTKEEKEIRDKSYISEAVGGSVIEVKYKGKVILRREGEKEIERIEGD